jgi:hypothetical protein
MKFVDNPRQVLRHWSTWALSTVVGIKGAWVSIPDDFKANLPHWVSQGVSWVVLVVAVLGLGAKFKAQNLPDPDAEGDKS